MNKKEPTLIINYVGGIDLLIERDAGNDVRIMTGNTKNSIEFWETLMGAAADALDELEQIETNEKVTKKQ